MVSAKWHNAYNLGYQEMYYDEEMIPKNIIHHLVCYSSNFSFFDIHIVMANSTP